MKLFSRQLFSFLAARPFGAEKDHVKIIAKIRQACSFIEACTEVAGEREDLLSTISARVWSLMSAVDSIRARLDVPLKAPRQRTYVTLRGSYERHVRIAGEETTEQVLHGWTQATDIEDGDNGLVQFAPYNNFTCERVDILGPACIESVSVGNETQNFPGYQNPATFEFKRKCEMGNLVTVRLKGTP